MQQQDNHEYPFLYQRQTCHQVQPNQATYQKRQKCQPATDRKSGSAGMPRPISYAVFCLKKKKKKTIKTKKNEKTELETKHDTVDGNRCETNKESMSKSMSDSASCSLTSAS